MKLKLFIQKYFHSQKRRDAVKLILFFFVVSVIFIFSSIPSFLDGGDYYFTVLIRKLGHYFVFGSLLFFSYKVFSLYRPFSFSQSLVYALLFSLAYAASDEWHQSFIFGRHGSIMDFYIDGLGILTAAFFIILEHEHQMRYPQGDHFIKI